MKSKSVAIVLGLLLACSVGFNLYQAMQRAQSAAPAETSRQLWTCGMDPQVIQEQPGQCPICGMNLVPMGAPAVANDRLIRIDPTTAQNIGIKLATVTQKHLARTLRTNGEITVDERRLHAVNLKYDGWVDKLFVNQTGQRVAAGDALFSVYSPDLVNAQESYLLARASSASVAAAARQRLTNWNMSDAQIRQLEQDGVAARALTVYSPAGGTVLSKNLIAGGSIMPGVDLYTIADLSEVWVIGSVYADELPWLERGAAANVRVAGESASERAGVVDFIYPTLDSQTRTASVRVVLRNSDYALRPGALAEVEIQTRARTTLAIPREAVVRSGTRDVVFVDVDSGRFEPRTVQLGLEADGNQYEVLSGLRAGEVVVTSAQFLLDSESQIQEALNKLMGSGDAPRDSSSDSPHEHNHGAGEQAAESTAPGTAERTVVLSTAEGATMSAVYTATALHQCPDHAQVISAEAKHSCPLCKRALSKMTDSAMQELRAASPVGCVMCPVVEPSTRSTERCPVCNMKLKEIAKP